MASSAPNALGRARSLKALAWLALLALWALAGPAYAQSDSADYARSRGQAPSSSAPSMRFAPQGEDLRYDVHAVDANTLVVYRPRSDAVGLEGFLIDVPSLLADLQERVLAQRGLATVARIEPVGARLEPDSERFSYNYRFAAPFTALQAGLALRPLDDAREAVWIAVLAAALALFILVGLFALYRMVAVQVHFAERRANFVSAVSHELKTPLTAIRMYGELLRDDLVEGDATRREYYGIITAESERLSRLVDNVLRLAKIERGERSITRPPERPPEPPTHALESALELLAPRAHALGFTLVVTIDSQLPAVRFDPDGLTQVLFNLLDNAFKYARDAEDKRIDVLCRACPEGVCLTVRDRGPGVSPSELERVFEPFFRAGNELVRRHEGVGLGLALVHGLVEGMHGSLRGRNAAPGFAVDVVLPSVRSKRRG